MSQVEFASLQRKIVSKFRNTYDELDFWFKAK